MLNRTGRVHCVSGDCLHGREHVFDAMVEFSNQLPLLFLDPFALGYIDADADDTMRSSFAVIGNETARLDPSHLATSANDTILYAIFAPALTKCLAAELFYPPYVVGCTSARHSLRAFSTVPSGKPWMAA